MGTGVLIPYLVGQHGQRDRQRRRQPLAARAGGGRPPGVFRLAFSVSRRLVAGRVSLGVEYDLRNRMYEHLHSLELAFFDGQQTGQLMSRATVDLQSVRFFLGYGLIFIVQSALTIVIAAGVMLVVDPGLAAIALAPMPFVIWVVVPLRAPQPAGAAGGPAAHRRADRGGRGEHLRRSRRQGVRAGGAPAAALQPRGRARLRPVDGLDAAARLLRALHRLPPPARARRRPVRRRAPGDQRLARRRRLRRLLRLRADADLADAHARHRARHGAARGGERRARVRAARPPARADRARRRARRCPPATGASSCAA